MDAVPQFFCDLEITRSSDHCFLSKVAIFQLEGVFCARLLLADCRLSLGAWRHCLEVVLVRKWYAAFRSALQSKEYVAYRISNSNPSGGEGAVAGDGLRWSNL